MKFIILWVLEVQNYNLLISKCEKSCLLLQAVHSPRLKADGNMSCGWKKEVEINNENALFRTVSF